MRLIFTLSRVGLSVLFALCFAGCARESEVSGPTEKGFKRSAQREERTEAHREFLAPSEMLRDQAVFSQHSQENLRAVERVWGDAAEIDVLSYDLRGSFDWQSEKLRATVTLNLEFEAGRAKYLALDSAVDEISSVRLGEGRSVPFEVDREREKLLISLQGLPQNRPLILEITYTASAGSNLHAVSARRDDPHSSRVVFSTAEPLGAAHWMPCHNRPDDRARFAATFLMSQDERLIANGRLLQDTVEFATSRRVMSYATEYELPTYLMAFAVGEFQVTEMSRAGQPLSVWSRRGVKFDAAEVLDILDRQMSHFESLLGPYPFEKYALVLLPQFPAGGIEHAGISFQAEDRSTEIHRWRDFSLTAHELAHQWFGDYVTVTTWDDLWVKEGMATLLAAEAMREFEDQNNSGHLFGSHFAFSDGAAIRDPDLAPNQKYTSGPYGRAAWFYTQLRSITGEVVFWKTLRDLLAEHAWGALSSNDVLAAFAESLTPAQQLAARRAIDARKVPRFERSDEGFRLIDDEASLLVPLEFRFLNTQGREESILLEAGSVLPDWVAAEAQSLVVFDPRGTHPRLAFFGRERPQLIPEQVKLSDIEGVIGWGPLAVSRVLMDTEAIVSPDVSSVLDFLPHLSSESSRQLLLNRVCASLTPQQVREGASERWMDAFLRLKARGSPSDSPLNFANCVTPERQRRLIGDLSLWVATGAVTESDVERTSWQLFSNEEALSMWGDVFLGATSLRVRKAVVSHLRARVAWEQDLLAQSPSREVWIQLANQILGRSATREVIPGSLALVESLVEVLPDFRLELASGYAELLEERLPARFVQASICSARKVLNSPDVWTTFIKDLSRGPNGLEAKRALQSDDYCL